MNFIFSLLIAVLLLNPQKIMAQSEQPVPLTVADAYLEMRSGPGAGYPIFNVVDRGQKIYIVTRKTSWYKVRTDNDKTGWVSRQTMLQTLLPSGQKLEFIEQNKESFIQRNWELGASTGELENAPVVSVYGAYELTQNISSELTLAYSYGNVSSSKLYKLSLLMQPFPEWEYSPFFTLGAGTIQVKPNATLINPADKNNALSQIGIGFKTYLTRRFILRAELNQYIIFSANNDKDQNEDITEWKIGFAVFF